MFAGGEFFYDGRWQVELPQVDTRGMNFLSGGKACLIVISGYLKGHGIDRILLPSYLCPTIVDTLERCGLSCDYYQVRRDLSIDIEDLTCKAAGHRAVYFINYFGFPHSMLERNFFTYLRQNGVLVVEDNAQAGFCEGFTGDFVFNSLRKVSPYDGGTLLTPLDVAPYIQQHRGAASRRLPLIREYREKLADYLYQGKGSHAELAALYRRAEEVYDADMVVEGDAQEREAIEHLDWSAMRARRRENYEYLLSLIADIPGISPVFRVLPEGAAPLGLPVYVSSAERDRLFDAMGEAGIGLTVHWDALLHDPRLNSNETAVEMAGSMLTLVTDQRWNHKHMDYQAQKLRESLSL